ncbi:MAG: hypothetical protein K0R65_1915 [Crocinitomicaceae bacterium]|jgi:hypothetical protein|nr:hypothetical protein [Crocinitomicaceae bacterium]
MKKLSILLVLCSAFFVLPACSKKKQIKNITSEITEGSWRISSYIDDSEDETSDYSGDTFTFKSDGTLIVTGTHQATGSWAVTKEDNSNDDDVFDDRHVEFIISLPALLDDLTDDWEVESHSSSRLELKDKSGGDGSEDYLTFVKI